MSALFDLDNWKTLTDFQLTSSSDKLTELNFASEDNDNYILLSNVNIQNCGNINALNLSSAKYLKTLFLSEIGNNLDPISQTFNLQLPENGAPISSITLTGMPTLKSLTLRNLPSLKNSNLQIANCPNLKTLMFDACE
jgi:hypothetical protein